MVNNNPIGLFDSGIGGTSIWREINHMLPGEDTIYLADSKNAPYGVRSKEEIIALSIKNAEFLINQGCKMIVVACNTATTNAITELRQKFDIPFIGIEPAIKPAIKGSQTQTVGILATKGTLSSALFSKTVELYSETKIIEQVGHGLVQLIEAGKIDSPEMHQLLKLYLQPMVDANIDYLVLGCSHYPYLIPQIKSIIPDHISIIDSGEAVAKQTRYILSTIAGVSSKQKGKAIFHTNVSPVVLSNILGENYDIRRTEF